MSKVIEIRKIKTKEFHYRWDFCYLIGYLEDHAESTKETPDIFYSNVEKPEEGTHFVTYYGEPCVANLVSSNRNQILKGRICFIKDIRSMEHLMDPESWA